MKKGTNKYLNGWHAAKGSGSFHVPLELLPQIRKRIARHRKSA